jgi:uncharacterized membrane protein
MHLYSVVLFLHIVVVLLAFGLSSSLHAGEWGGHRATTVAELRVYRRTARLEPLFPLFTVLLFVLGAWLVHLSHGSWEYGDAWVSASIAALVVLLVVGGAVLAPRSKVAGAALAAAPEGPIDPALRAVLNDRISWQMGHLNTGMAIAVIYLMTSKPGAAGSIVALIIGAAAGFAIGTVGASKQSAVQPSMTAI